MAREVVVITGSSAGVGRATAQRFARQGAAVALLARGPDGLAGAVADIQAAGGVALAIPVDVSDSAQVEAAAERIEKELGPIDIWINCAMVTIFSPFHQLTPDEYRRSTEVTYLGTVYGTMAALKRMRSRNRGTIVQVGSALAYRAIPLQSVYCGAKFAIRGFTDSVRTELIHDKSAIHITMVQLAAFNTPQFDWARVKMKHQPQPIPPIFQPEIAAEAIEWSAHHRRRELWVAFPALKTIVGTTLFPSLADRMAAKQAWSGQFDKKAPPPAAAHSDNLYEPVAGDHGAHGRFDQQARTSSWELWMAIHRRTVGIGLVLALVVITCLVVLLAAQ